MLVCINCARPVVFADSGWIHRQESTDCGRPAIAWPPAVAEAEVDTRLLAGTHPDDWLRQIVERIDDERVEVSYIYEHEPDPTVSPWDTEMAGLIESVLREAYEDAVVVPSTAIVGTDNRFLRPLGIPAYGFIPCLLSQAERDGFHANDEFLTVDNFNMGMEIMFEVVRRFCAK